MAIPTQGLFDSILRESGSGTERGPEELPESSTEKLRGIDELFADVREYASSSRFMELMKFTARFKMYAVYNAMLIYLQRPGSAYVLSPSEWEKRFDRQIKHDVRPILILHPMGPLRCVYDVSDTLPIHKDRDRFPPELANPFDGDPKAPVEPAKLHMLEERLPYLGICYETMQTGGNYAGKLALGQSNDPPLTLFGHSLKPAYSLRIQAGANDTAKFCTIIHELGHLFLRHLRSGYEREWRLGRRLLPDEAEEFEAETVAWLVARRMGIDHPAYRYLAHYLDAHGEIPRETSVEEIIRAVNRVERIMASEEEAIEFYEKYNPSCIEKHKAYRESLKNRGKKA